MYYMPVIILPFGMAYSYYYGFTPLLLPLAFLVISVFTYYVYAKDKSAAESAEWRVPENTLHMYSLFFGWPGAIVAQQRLRHKTRKVSFRIVFWLTVMVNVSAVGWVHTEKGNRFLYGNVVELERFLLKNVSERHASNAINILTGFNRNNVNYIYRSIEPYKQFN